MCTVHLWSIEPQGFGCVFVCVYVGGEVTLILPTHSTPRSPTLIERQGLQAGIGSESRCAFLTSPASPLSHLQPLIYSHTCLECLICPHGKHKSMSLLLSVYLWRLKKCQQKLITRSYSKLIKYCHWVCDDRGERSAECRFLGMSERDHYGTECKQRQLAYLLFITETLKTVWES